MNLGVHNPLLPEGATSVWADNAEDLLPSLSYRALVENLPLLTELGVIAEGSLPMMLVVARLVDRRRILQSRMSAMELECALEQYRAGLNGRPLGAVEGALEQAVHVVQNRDREGAACTGARGDPLADARGSVLSLENEAEAAA